MFLVIGGLALLCAGLELAARLLPTPDISRYRSTSQSILAADGGILRTHLTDDGYFRLPTRAADLTLAHLDMLLAIEDRRFRDHPGVDVLALARAVRSAIGGGRVRSGASTITMQVARLLSGRERGIWGKLGQMHLARRLELSFSKAQILDMYLTLTPFGGNIEGVRAASLTYFGREPAELAAVDAALLIALPQAPEARRPDRHMERAIASRNRILDRLQGLGRLSAADIAGAATSRPARYARPSQSAFHLAERLRGQDTTQIIHTLIVRKVQSEVEMLGERAVAAMGSRANVAVVVVRNRDMAVTAWLGGARFLDEERAGYVDLARAVRSPGSTLKPFIYGLAFDKLALHPETIVSDAPHAYGNYQPENFGSGYDGDVTVRQALKKSLNTTAIFALDRIGVPLFVDRIRRSGAVYHVPGGLEAAGLPIGLGGGGVTLADLALLYASIANDGLARPLRLLRDDPIANPVAIMKRDAAWAIRDILAEMPAPEGLLARRARDGGRRIAYKTGTSYGFRDAWAIGFDADHTVAVWTGRPDSAPNDGATGAKSAAPLLHRIFDALPVPAREVVGPPPPGSILTSAKDLPHRLQRVGIRSVDKDRDGFRIAFPTKGSSLYADRCHGQESRRMLLSVNGGVPPFRWIVNELMLPEATNDRQLLWATDHVGEVDLVVVDAAGRTANSSFWISRRC